VLMADGTTKPISKVQVGDKVLATDPETGRTEVREVNRTIVGDGEKDLVDITIRTDAGNKVIVATKRHPFWVEAMRQWIDAAELQAGDMLRTASGDEVAVAASHAYQRIQRVHNLTVDGIHTYYVHVGRTSVLVHNCPMDDGSIAPRDIHGQLRRAERDVKVDEVLEHGDMYVQISDGQIVRALDNGDGTSDVVIRDLSNPSGQATTRIAGMSNRSIQRRLDDGEWE
jgi:Pretoxin HINT domain